MADNSSFAFKMFIFSLVALFTLPLMLNVFVPQYEIDADDYDSIMEDYYSFTGVTKGKTSETVWALEGIYTPYGQDAQGNPNTGWGYTDDGWIYGSLVSYNRPSQYIDTQSDFDVIRDPESGLYRYASNSADYDEPKTQTDKSGQTIQIGVDKDGNPVNTLVTNGQGHAKGDLYTSIVFDRNYKSDIFFSEAMKYTQSGDRYTQGSDEPFYYAFTGYRYAMVPISSSYTLDAQGNQIEISRAGTSLSLIWYSYYRSDGISGNLVISGNDQGVSYLTSDAIIRAFDSNTSVAKFNLTFNHGTQVNVYVKIDARELANGRTVEECYNLGYWSVMITSLSVDVQNYMAADFELNIWSIFETIVKLMTFDYSDYQMSPLLGAVCSFVIVIPLYAGLLALAMGSWPALAAVGIAGAIETLIAVIPKVPW